MRGVNAEMKPDGEVVVDSSRAVLLCISCHGKDIGPIGVAARIKKHGR